MHFNLIVHWLDLAISKDVHQHNDWAVRDTNALSKSLLHTSFQVSPRLMERNSFNGAVGVVNRYIDVVGEVEVDVVELELLETRLKGALDILSLCDPELCGNEKLLTLDSGRKTLLEGFADTNFVAI